MEGGGIPPPDTYNDWIEYRLDDPSMEGGGIPPPDPRRQPPSTAEAGPPSMEGGGIPPPDHHRCSHIIVLSLSFNGGRGNSPA